MPSAVAVLAGIAKAWRSKTRPSKSSASLFGSVRSGLNLEIVPGAAKREALSLPSCLTLLIAADHCGLPQTRRNAVKSRRGRLPACPECRKPQLGFVIGPCSNATMADGSNGNGLRPGFPVAIAIRVGDWLAHSAAGLYRRGRGIHRRP